MLIIYFSYVLDAQNDDLLSIQKVQNKLLRFLNGVSLKEHHCTEDLLEKSNMLSVNRINAQSKITEVWKALFLDPNENSFKASLPNTNQDERVSRSKTRGLLNIKGSSNGARNSFKNDGKILWNNAPLEITQASTLLPPKAKIKKFVNTLPM